MLKQNKGKLILSSLVILLPAVLGLLFWDKLPLEIPTHWGIDGQPDGYSGRGFFLTTPLLMLAIHWAALWVTTKDPRNADQSPKAFGLLIWAVPAVSLMTMGFTWCVAMGHTFSALRLMGAVLGILFAALGNFMPKFRRNHTIGIKVKWALQNEENWNATHRFGGKVWIVCGMALLCCLFLPEEWLPILLPVVIAPMALLPILYSWLFHRKQQAEGNAPEPIEDSPFGKKTAIFSAVFFCALAVFLVFILFTGDIDCRLDATELTVEASFEKDLTLPYDRIDSLELREEGVDGFRVMGFASSRLLMGTFQNDEFGTYTRYTYTGDGPAIVIEARGKTLVIGLKEPADTLALFEALSEKVG